MNPIILILLVLLCLGAFGGGFAGLYPASYGYGGGGILIVVLILVVLFLR